MKIQTQKLRQLLGTEEAVQRFVDLFRQQLPDYLDALNNASAEKDWETVSISAHALKSQCNYLGLEEAARYMESLEHQPELPLDTALLAALSAI